MKQEEFDKLLTYNKSRLIVDIWNLHNRLGELERQIKELKAQ
jgi:hypothetical protein